ncbi:MAG: hypothetical protein HY370_03835 [Proteobacteria bacterium]|nr:hypothetical protein [Pseudomonadota bacterium]
MHTYNAKIAKKRAHGLALCSIVILLAFIVASAGPAWSFEAYKTVSPSAAVNTAETPVPLTSSKPAIADDSCLSLLKTVRYDNPASSAMDRGRSSDGQAQAAALGLVLGVRFALGPREVVKSNRGRVEIRQPFSTTNDSYALAVADYRRCKNEQALKALNDEWRWSR